jgi:hypothetical protein
MLVSRLYDLPGYSGQKRPDLDPMLRRATKAPGRQNRNPSAASDGLIVALYGARSRDVV